MWIWLGSVSLVLTQRKGDYEDEIAAKIHCHLQDQTSPSRKWYWYSIYIARFLCMYIQMRFTTPCGGLFARLLDGAVHNQNVTRRSHRYHKTPEQNRMSEATPQHREPHALLFYE